MKRDLAALANTKFDLLVIGGGVIGACIARDAARRGMSVALIEQNDLASAASEAMSRTIHGGLRYLSSGQLSLVRQGLNERAIWRRIAPDFIGEQTWLLPLPSGLRGIQTKFGVGLYQWLSGRNAAPLTSEDMMRVEPHLASSGPHGAAAYQDFHLADPHRLILALLNDAVLAGAQVANYVEASGLSQTADKSNRVDVVDHISGTHFAIAATIIVNATGPWAEKVASQLVPTQHSVKVTGSKGIHIVTPPLSTIHAIAVAGKGEHLFVVPWHGMSLFGTTDDAYAGDLNSVKATPREIEQFQAKVARLLPHARPLLDKTLGSFAGVRSLPGAKNNTYRTEREELIVDHQIDGASNFFTVTGGKWTTSRSIAQTFVDAVVARMPTRLRPCDTKSAVLARSIQPDNLADELRYAARSEMALTSEDHFRRMGRHRFLLDPDLKQRTEHLLATMTKQGNTALGRNRGLS